MMGTGTFRANEDVDFGAVICPACDSPFVPEELVFKGCKAEVVYCKSGEKASRIRFNTVHKDKCETFGGHETPLARYTSLIIVVEADNENLPPNQQELPQFKPIPRITRLQPSQPTQITLRTTSPRRALFASSLHTNKVYTEGASGMNPSDLNPQTIRFCQDSCADKFICGLRLIDTLKQLKAKLVSAYGDIPTIRVFWWEEFEAWFTEDNRRLKVYQDAGLDKVPVRVVAQSNVDQDKLTTMNEGRSIRVRGPSYTTSTRLLR